MSINRFVITYLTNQVGGNECCHGDHHFFLYHEMDWTDAMQVGQ